MLGGRGVVSSASYEAREFGVRSAMPAVRARRLCPGGVFLPPDFEAYQAHSNRFREVLLAHTPLVEPISLDEAFLDVGGATMLFGEPREIAARIRAEVEREVGVTCSVGVAPTKFVAKLACDHCKPNGMLVVAADGVLGFLEPLPVRRLWGVGEKTGEVLARLAVRTVGDLAATPESILDRLLGEQVAAHLRQLSHGIDDREVVPYEAPKSVGHEETFERDLDDDENLLRELLALSGRVARAAARADGYRARTVTMKAAPGELHDAHPIADARRRDRRRRRPVPHGRRASTGRCLGSAGGSGCWGCRRADWSRPAPNSSRCCTASDGATSSAPSIGSSAGSAAARRMPASLLDRARPQRAAGVRLVRAAPTAVRR